MRQCCSRTEVGDVFVFGALVVLEAGMATALLADSQWVHNEEFLKKA